MDLTKVQAGWYLLRSQDAFLDALADYWRRPLTDDERLEVLRPQINAFPMLVIMTPSGDDYGSFPLLQGSSLESLNRAFEEFNNSS